MLLLDVLPIPVVDENKKKEEDIEYAYILLAVSKFILSLKDIYPQLIQISFKVGYTVLQTPTTSEIHKTFVLDILS